MFVFSIKFKFGRESTYREPYDSYERDDYPTPMTVDSDRPADIIRPLGFEYADDRSRRRGRRTQ